MARDPEKYRIETYLTPAQYQMFLLFCTNNKAEFVRNLIRDKAESKGYIWPDDLARRGKYKRGE